MANRSVHDMGGTPAGPVDTGAHEPTLTERRIDAMMQLLRTKPRSFWRTDENRRAIESLAPETYASSGYYQKWAYAMRTLLVEKGLLTAAEIDQRLVEVKMRHGVLRPAGKMPRRKPPASADAAAAGSPGKTAPVASKARAKVAAAAGPKKPAKPKAAPPVAKATKARAK
jgi:hypothetical protein